MSSEKNETVVNIGLQESLNQLEENKKLKKSIEIPSGVYVFVSFDLVNSTKFKYRNSHWVDMIKELIKTANNHWFGLDFWKFNGDELLYYAEIVSVSQLVLIIHKLAKAANDLEYELIQKLHDDNTEVGFESDLIGIKTAIWLAVVSDDTSSLNSKLFDFDSVDFAGINMDEGFRMSKCAIQNKIIVDPKIALIITSIADEVISNRVQNLTKNDIFKIEELEKPTLFNDVFSKFWLSQENKEYDYEIKDMFKVVANNFRIVGYENCKGVWDDRPYPIIWYSDDWDTSIANIKYDESYNGKKVNYDFINYYYGNEKDSYKITFETLKKIYKNISAYSLAIRQILLNSNLKLLTITQLDKHIVSKTYLYHSIVCVNEKTKGILIFLRSKDRGHLPCVWDFDQQKNAQDTHGESMIKQITQRFKNNFNLDVEILYDEKRKSIIPIAIQPIYRKGKMHHGVVCVAKICNDLDESNIIAKVKKSIPKILSGYGYPLYDDATFIHIDQCKMKEQNQKPYIDIEGNKIFELSNNETSSDSNSWQNHNKYERTENRCTTNMVITIQEVLELIESGKARFTKSNEQQ